MQILDNLRYSPEGAPYSLNLHERELKLVMGVPHKFLGRMPADYETQPQYVGNVKVWITKSKGPGSQHRVMCECPHCTKVMGAGRLHQHIKTKTCELMR